MLERNPFEVIDEEGVGELMRIAVERGRGVKDDLRWASAASTAASPGRSRSATASGSTTSRARPYRVPLARLAAAQAALAEAAVEAAVAGG